ncbi:MAG: 3-oxoacyl-[acyl-carrier-protein] synthase 3 protein 2 [Myxococcota bacterium]|nr:3-oxoacyl-[acyl-carrier-protein] synthase 3 protein 2 [Myxococcota bacterium]
MQKFEKLVIAGVACVDAPHRIPSKSIEDQLLPVTSRLDIKPDILTSLTGIEARRFWDPGVMPSDAAAMAAEKVLEQTGVPRDRIGVLINTSVCRDYVEPSTACIVHGNLGLPASCMNFDVGNACLAFMNGMEIAGHMIEREQIDYALIVDGEGSRFVTEQTIERLLRPETDAKDFRSQFATLTLGSGGAAMVLTRADLYPAGHRVIGSVQRAATEHSRLCYGQNDIMRTDAKALLLAGLQLASGTWEQARSEMGWSDSVLNELVLHQVSQVHTTQLCSLLDINMDKAYKLYPEFGNVGPASVPIVLAKALEEGRIQPGHRVALMGIGSGLNCMMAEVIW